jgi:hypothetical protein
MSLPEARFYLLLTCGFSPSRKGGTWCSARGRLKRSKGALLGWYASVANRLARAGSEPRGALAAHPRNAQVRGHGAFAAEAATAAGVSRNRLIWFPFRAGTAPCAAGFVKNGRDEVPAAAGTRARGQVRQALPRPAFERPDPSRMIGEAFKPGDLRPDRVQCGPRVGMGLEQVRDVLTGRSYRPAG